MSRLRDLSRRYAERTAAYKRVALRRWLREKIDAVGLPMHLFLGWREYELIGEVKRRGGDPDKIIEQARKEVVGKIMRGE